MCLPSPRRVSRAACIEHFLQELACLIFSLTLYITICMLTYCIAYDNGIWYLIRCSVSFLVVSPSVGFMHGGDCLTMVHVCLCHSVAVYLLRGCISIEWPSWPNGC